MILTFGTGPRGCPGEKIAMKMSGLVLARLLHSFELTPLTGSSDNIAMQGTFYNNGSIYMKGLSYHQVD